MPETTAPTPNTYRALTDHIVNPANDRINITVLDEPGSGGANHAYAIEWKAREDGQGFRDLESGDWHDATILRFQNGPIAEVGVNGLTHEALLAVLVDRLRAFQKGPFANAYNAIALNCLEAAVAALKARTLERMNRGVEGTHAV